MMLDFRPQRITEQSKLSHQVNENALSARRGTSATRHISEQLLEEG